MEESVYDEQDAHELEDLQGSPVRKELHCREGRERMQCMTYKALVLI